MRISHKSRYSFCIFESFYTNNFYFLQYQNQRNWERMRKEHTNVSRIIKQLKELLYQMDTLRAQVLDVDIEQFDKLTANARTSIMNAIKEYLGKKRNTI